MVNRGTNPTFVNNFPLLKGSSSLLADGDLIQIGKSGDVLLKFQLRCPTLAFPRVASSAFTAVNRYLSPSKRQFLKVKQKQHWWVKVSTIDC
ncbi:MAG: FHA domain-containing protein [Hormoscilla sp. GUM202]|nr:FHA domain-containing protein [Hormoscilla sp. GUM202]